MPKMFYVALAPCQLALAHHNILTFTRGDMPDRVDIAAIPVDPSGGNRSAKQQIAVSGH
jgi:hypothetical protein